MSMTGCEQIGFNHLPFVNSGSWFFIIFSLIDVSTQMAYLRLKLNIATVIPHQKIKLGRNNQILLKSWGISCSYKKEHQLFSLLAQKKQILEGIT